MIRRTALVSSAIALAVCLLARPATAGHTDRGAWVRNALRSWLLGDATAEQKETLKALRDQFREGARPVADVLRSEGKRLAGEVKAALSDEDRAKLKSFASGVRAMTFREKLGLLRSCVQSLDSPEMRSDVRTWLRGGPAERNEAGERIARSAARVLVPMVGSKAGLGDDTGKAIVAAIDGFLERTRAERGDLRTLAGDKLRAAWAVLTPEQKDRVRGGLRMVRAWLIGSAPADDAGGSR